MEERHPHHPRSTPTAAATALHALTRLDGATQVHHGLFVPGTHDARIDHLVIGPSGAWAVSVKHWDATLTEDGGMLWRGHYPLHLELSVALAQAERAAARLGTDVRPVLCFAGTRLPRPVQEVSGVHVVDVDALTALVTDAPAVLDADAVAEADRWAGTMARRSEVGPDRRPIPSRHADDAVDLLAGPFVDDRLHPARLRRGLAKATLAVVATLSFMYVFPRVVDALETRPEPPARITEHSAR